MWGVSSDSNLVVSRTELKYSKPPVSTVGSVLIICEELVHRMAMRRICSFVLSVIVTTKDQEYSVCVRCNETLPYSLADFSSGTVNVQIAVRRHDYSTIG